MFAVDYLTFGQAEWTTESATDSGFSRGVVREPVILTEESDDLTPSVLRLSTTCCPCRIIFDCEVAYVHGADNPPIVPSRCAYLGMRPIGLSAKLLTCLASCLKATRICEELLTDYGFIGHPFRKDFP